MIIHRVDRVVCDKRKWFYGFSRAVASTNVGRGVLDDLASRNVGQTFLAHEEAW